MPHPGQLHLVVPTCIVVKDQKFLIIKRRGDEIVLPDKWQFPGGKLDRSEYGNRPKDTDEGWYNLPEETLRREIREETGLDVETPQYLRSFVFIRPDDLATLVLRYWARWKEHEVRLSPDHTEFAWIKPQDAPAYDIITGLPEEIVHLAQVLKLS